MLVAAPIALLMGLVPADAHGPVDSADIVDQSIRKIDIGADAVGTSEIVTSGVGKAEIANNAVGASEILQDAVRSSEIASGAVGASEIATNAVGASEIATNAVGADEIASGAVGADELATGSVAAGEIGTGAVGADEIASGAVEAAEIATGAVGADEVANDIQIETARTYTAAGSFQLLAADLTLDPAAGSSTATDPDFLASVMGNTMGENLTATSNYIGGVIGHYNVTGTNASTYPTGGVLAGIGDGTTTADGAFVAYTDGDSAVTTAEAAFKVMNNNSNVASGFDYGLDLQDEARDGFQAVDENFYNKAPLRLVRDVVVLVGNAAPVDGTTGDDVAGTGSLYVDTAAGKLYINTGPSTAPVWVPVGTQS